MEIKTPKQQRIAIAEARGWHHCHCIGGVPCGIPPGIKSNDDDCQMEVPRITLEAMHEAEKVLTTKQFIQYVKQLGLRTGLGSEAIATAAQRAEAFLQTVKG